MANPLIDDFRRQQRLPVSPDMAPLIAPAMPTGPIAIPPSTSPMVRLQDPSVSATQTRLLGDQANQQRMLDTGPGISQIKNPLLRGLAHAGDIAERILLPGAESVTPGTEGNHERLLAMGAGRIGQDLNNAREQAQTALLDAQPQLKQQALENQLLKTENQGQHYQDMAELGHERNRTNLRNHGFALDESDPSGNSLRPLRYDEMSEQQQAVLDINHVNEELRKAQKEYQEARTKNLPVQMALAQQRIDGATQARGVAMQKLGLQREAQDFAQDKFYNPQPTGQERNKKDLADSATHYIDIMKEVRAEHPEMFGPGEGRSTQFQAWLGSQDPAAQRYLAASKVAADHLTAVFGARSKYALEGTSSLFDPKINNAAFEAAYGDLKTSVGGFQKAGTTHGKPGTGSATAPGGRKAMLNGKPIEVKGDKWVYSDTGKAVE